MTNLATLKTYLEPLAKWLNDESVSEILINRPQHVFIERAGIFETQFAETLDYRHLAGLANLIARYSDQRLSEKEPLLSGGASVFLMLTAYLFFSSNKTPNLYGNARFANRNVIQKSGLFSEQDILLGRAFNKDLILDGYEHVTVFAPTGTGKTTSISIPNLLQ